MKTLSAKIIWPKPGIYVIAVSGGVDSCVLLDLLAKPKIRNPKFQLIVAHLDHGMRSDSGADRKFVEKVAAQYHVPFEYGESKLGVKATEEQARVARYEFLNQIKSMHTAKAIITAHHLDDSLETAIFNAGRGADSWGLTSLHLNQDVLRPLLNISKSEILAYAKVQKLKWQEDSTNQHLDITRNFIRQIIVPGLPKSTQAKLIRLASSNQARRDNLQTQLEVIAKVDSKRIQFKRISLLALETDLLKDVLRLALINLGLKVENLQLTRVLHFVKTAKSGKNFQLSSNLQVVINNDMVTLVNQEATGL